MCPYYSPQLLNWFPLSLLTIYCGEKTWVALSRLPQSINCKEVQQINKFSPFRGTTEVFPPFPYGTWILNKPCCMALLPRIFRPVLLRQSLRIKDLHINLSPFRGTTEVFPPTSVLRQNWSVSNRNPCGRPTAIRPTWPHETWSHHLRVNGYPSMFRVTKSNPLQSILFSYPCNYS